MPAVTFDKVDIVFGERPQTALPLLDQGLSREQILAETGQVLGVAGCSLTVERGEICVLMGLSGSGKSTLLRAVNRLNSVVRGSVQVEDDGRPVDVARFHSTRGVSGAGATTGFRTMGGSSGLKVKSSSLKVRLGGSASSGPAAPALSRNAAIESIVAEPTTSATAATACKYRSWWT